MGEVPSFGAWLKRRRKALDLTQADAGAAGRLRGGQHPQDRGRRAAPLAPDRRAPRPASADRSRRSRRPSCSSPAWGWTKPHPRCPSPRPPSCPPARRRINPISSSPRLPSYAHAARPSGTVTFLFSDIEGSTQLWEHTPEAMRRALARHDQIMADAIAAAGGYAYKTIGDAFQAAFADRRAGAGRSTGRPARLTRRSLGHPTTAARAHGAAYGRDRRTSRLTTPARCSTASRACWRPATVGRSCSRWRQKSWCATNSPPMSACAT